MQDPHIFLVDLFRHVSQDFLILCDDAKLFASTDQSYEFLVNPNLYFFPFLKIKAHLPNVPQRIPSLPSTSKDPPPGWLPTVSWTHTSQSALLGKINFRGLISTKKHLFWIWNSRRSLFEKDFKTKKKYKREQGLASPSCSISSSSFSFRCDE